MNLRGPNKWKLQEIFKGQPAADLIYKLWIGVYAEQFLQYQAFKKQLSKVGICSLTAFTDSIMVLQSELDSLTIQQAVEFINKFKAAIMFQEAAYAKSANPKFYFISL